MSDKRVYVINRGQHDYEDALRYGKIVWLSEDVLNPNNYGLIGRLANQMAKDSQPEDYILVTGLASHLSILAGAFVHRWGKLNLLIFDPKSRKYKERNIKFIHLITGLLLVGLGIAIFTGLI